VDAFRHAYWMALLAQKIKYHKALKLGIAHEKGNKKNWLKGKLEENARADSISTVMDLENNCSGLNLGCLNKSLNSSELKNLIISEIKKGNLKILKKDSSGNYLDCSGNRIIETEWKNKWYVPKCLISSKK